MPEHGVRSVYSACPFEILALDDHGVVSSATAFFVEFGEVSFVVTNWHVVSGKHFLTKEPIDAGRRVPTRIMAKLATYDVGNRDRGEFGIAPFEINLFESEDPVWLEHPELGSDCDVVAIPLERPDSCPSNLHRPANSISSVRIPVEPGGTVFIIGFPEGVSVGFGLPLWKSGYIASEPHYDVTVGGEQREFGGLVGGREVPAFFVDTRTRRGMSGSPVFARYVGSWDSRDPYRKSDPFDDPDFLDREDYFLGGAGTEFVGCYSGRVLAREEGAALGLCWGKHVIETICSARRRGRHPHVTYAQ